MSSGDTEPLDLSVYFNVLSRDQLEHLVIKLLMKDDSVFDVLRTDATAPVLVDVLTDDIHNAIVNSDEDPMKLITGFEPIAERASSYLQMKHISNAAVVLNELTRAFVFFLLRFCEERGLQADIEKDRAMSKQMLKRVRRSREAQDNLDEEENEDDEEDQAELEEAVVRGFLQTLEKHWSTFTRLVCTQALAEHETNKSETISSEETDEDKSSTTAPAAGAEKKAFRVLTGPGTTGDHMVSGEFKGEAIVDPNEMSMKLAPKTPLELFTTLAGWYTQLGKYLGPVFSDALRQCKSTMVKLGLKPPTAATNASTSTMATAPQSNEGEVTVGPSGRPRKTLLKVSK